MFNYPVILAPDGDTVMATFPDVPESITFGHTSRLDQLEAAAKALGRQIDVMLA